MRDVALPSPRRMALQKQKIKEIMSDGLFVGAKKGDKFIRKDGSVVEYLQHVSIKDGGRAFFVFDEDKSNCYFVDEKGVSFGDDRSLDIVCRDNEEDDFITAVAIKEIGCFDKHLIEIFKKGFKLSKVLNRNEAPNFASNDTNWRRYV